MKEEVRREEGTDGVEGNQEGGGKEKRSWGGVGGMRSGLRERKRDNRGGAKQRGKGSEERRGATLHVSSPTRRK